MPRFCSPEPVSASARRGIPVGSEAIFLLECIPENGVEEASIIRNPLAPTRGIAQAPVVYFCDPRNPWQRGTNENTNRLIRQCLPNQSDLSEHSQAELNKIAPQLNQRPRKTLEFRCPVSSVLY